MADFVVKASGQQEEFSTGAKRDTQEGKPQYTLIPVRPKRRVALHFTAGARKYGPRNWEKGMPFSRVLDSLQRHVEAFREGCQVEDHLAAIVCNAMFLMEYQEKIREGTLPPTLDDVSPLSVAMTTEERAFEHYRNLAMELGPLTVESSHSHEFKGILLQEGTE